MSTKAIDEVLSRWFRDGKFRTQVRNNPEQALANYDLTLNQREWFLSLKKQAAENEPETVVPSEDETAVPNWLFSLN